MLTDFVYSAIMLTCVGLYMANGGVTMINELETAKRVVGIKQVKRAVLAKQAVKVFLADDADPALTESLQQICVEQGIETERVKTMSLIGKACRIAVGAACAAILG